MSRVTGHVDKEDIVTDIEEPQRWRPFITEKDEGSGKRKTRKEVTGIVGNKEGLRLRQERT